MGDSAWQQIWRDRLLPRDGHIGLSQLMAADGFDAFGGVDEHAWRSYIGMFTARMDIRPGESVFEVGCGAGAFLLPLSEAGCTVGGIDYSPELVAVARAAIPTAQIDVADAIDLNVVAGFDVVVSNGVFLYFPDFEYAAEVLARMLAASQRGIAVLDVPDLARQAEATSARQKWLGEESYSQKYVGLRHLYYERDWFESTIGDSDFDVEVADQELRGYFHTPYRFNVFVRCCT